MLVLRADAALRGVSGVEVTVELACGSMSDMAIYRQLPPFHQVRLDIVCSSKILLRTSRPC